MSAVAAADPSEKIMASESRASTSEPSESASEPRASTPEPSESASAISNDWEDEEEEKELQKRLDAELANVDEKLNAEASMVTRVVEQERAKLKEALVEAVRG